MALLVTLLREICMVGCWLLSPHPSVFAYHTRVPIPASGSHRHTLENKIPAKDFNHQMSNSRSTSYITEIDLTKQIITIIPAALFLFLTPFLPGRRELSE